MRILLRIILVIFGLAAIAKPAEAREPIQKGSIVVVPIKGTISPPLLLFMRRAMKSAEAAEAAALIFEMDTYGGRLDTASDIIAVLNHATIPTYTFINPNAGSAGSLIALATKHIYMSPASAIGAAAPVLSTGEDLPATERDKTVSYWSALIRSTATRNGHNPDIGEAFMTKKKEVKIGERIIHPKGTLLTFSAQEAIEKVDGKPVLAEGIADSTEDLIKKADLKGALTPFDPTGFERLAFWITMLAPFLLLLGIICAYLEFKIPGASLPGIIAAVCFALFFLGHYLAGLAGWEVVALFTLGFALIVIEVLFFAHSTIVIGVVGVFLILASILWAMIDRYPGEDLLPTREMIAIPMRNLLIALVAATIAIIVLARYLPKTSLYRRFALMTSNPSGTSIPSVPRDFGGALGVSTGMTGKAVTNLRPSGKAQFADHTLDVVTEGEFINAQTLVKVTQADGMRIVVKKAG